MFEELDYKCDINEERIRYYNNENNYYVVFFIEYKMYTIGCFNENEDIAIDIPINKAINKQVEELGWNK